MKRFRFKLQTLLDHRKAREEQLQIELAQVMRDEARELALLRKLRRDLEAACDGLAAALGRSASPIELARRDEHAKTLRDDVKVQRLTLQAVRERVDAKRTEVIAAMKERKVLETLRDNQERAYLVEASKAEQNGLDEMASLRYAREL